MSYQNKDIVVTPDFFLKRSNLRAGKPTGVVTVIPPVDIYSGGGKGGATRARLADCAVDKCTCTFFRDISPYVSAGLKKTIEDNNLFAFGYSFDRMQLSYHVRIIISTQPKVELKWYKEDIWAILRLSAAEKNSYLGMVEYSNCGKYSTYRYNRHEIEAAGNASFDCSHFRVEDGEIKICAFNRAKNSFIVIPKAKFEILDERGLNALGSEIESFLKANAHHAKVDSPDGLKCPITPGTDLIVTKEMLAKYDHIDLIPNVEKADPKTFPDGWPSPRILSDITPFITPEFAQRLSASKRDYLTFAIDNGFHPDMPTGIPTIVVVIATAEKANLEIFSNYRADMKPDASEFYAKVRFYRCPMMGGYSIECNSAFLGHDFDGLFDVDERAVHINDKRGFDLLELEMHRGNL